MKQAQVAEPPSSLRYPLMAGPATIPAGREARTTSRGDNGYSDIIFRRASWSGSAFSPNRPKSRKPRTWIENAGHEVYLPLCRDHRRLQPLFKRYLFVRIDQQWHDIMTLPGVSQVLMAGERPAILRLTMRERRKRKPRPTRIITGDEVIEAIKQQAGPDGVIELNRPADARWVREPFDRGQILRVRDVWHVLHGRDLTFQGMRAQDRVRVMLTWFGQSSIST
jgi:hypothetical protein